MQVLQLLSVLYTLFMIVAPIIVIGMLINTRNELRALGERQRRMAAALDEANDKLSSLGMSVTSHNGERASLAAGPTWNVLASPGPSTAGEALTALLADPEIAKSASDVRRIYGADVCVSFLKRKAGERGLTLPQLTAADLPGEF